MAAAGVVLSTGRMPGVTAASGAATSNEKPRLGPNHQAEAEMRGAGGLPTRAPLSDDSHSGRIFTVNPTAYGGHLTLWRSHQNTAATRATPLRRAWTGMVNGRLTRRKT